MKTLLVITLLLLSACGRLNPLTVLDPAVAITESPVSGKPLKDAKKTVNIDKYVLDPCPALQPVEDNPTELGVLRAKRADAIAYRECLLKNKILVKILKEAFNINEKQP